MLKAAKKLSSILVRVRLKAAKRLPKVKLRLICRPSVPTRMSFGKVNGLSKAGKHKEVVAELQEFEDAVVESNELLAIYVKR